MVNKIKEKVILRYWKELVVDQKAIDELDEKNKLTNSGFSKL